MLRAPKAVLVLLIVAFTLAACAAAAAAAPSQPPAKMSNFKLQINIVEGFTFWSYPYLTKDGVTAKPANIQVIWDVGAQSGQPIVIAAGKDVGELVIAGERGALITYRVNVRDAKNVVLGSFSQQVVNKGQTVKVQVGAPEYTEPMIKEDTSFVDPLK